MARFPVARQLVIVAMAVAVGSSTFGFAYIQPATKAGIDLAGQVEVARLVDLSAQRLKLNIEYDANALKAAGQVTLRLDAGLSDEELWDLTNRVLIARGFATVRVPGKAAYTVVKLADAPAIAGSNEPAPGDYVAGYRTAVVRAKHRTGKELVESVTKILSKTGSSAIVLKEGGEGALIVLSDASTRVDQALSLITIIDVPSEQAVVEEIPVHNYTAQQVAIVAAQVNAKRELVTGEKLPGEVLPSPDGAAVLLVCDARSVAVWKDLIVSLDRRERLETVTYAPRVFAAKEVARLIEAAIKPSGGGGGGGDERWKLVTDDLTGSLIINATPAQHEQVRALIDRLDSTSSAARRPVRSFTIRNRPVREIQSILEQLVQSGVLASDSASPANTATSGVTGVTPWPPPSGANFVAPGSAPALPGAVPATQPTPPSQPVLSLPRPLTETSFGSQSDRNNPPDLVLSVDEGTNTLIAMGEPRLLSQIESLLQTLDVRQPQVMLEVLIVSLSDSQTLDLGVELEAIGMTDDVRSRIASLFGLGTRAADGTRIAGDGLGLTGVVLNPGDFSIIVRALQTLNKGRSLSIPKLLVTNNQQATLDSVLEQPFASTNASNTVTTTSFGGTKPAGTQITLKPQIAEGDHLLLDYNISLSAFVGAAANASLPPPRQENKVQSAASLPDGHTVVVGGIELNSEGKATNQVPGFARIPLIGELFKNRSNTNSRNRFFVFIRANILRHRSFEDLKYLSEVAAGHVAVEDGWPVVEPRVIR
jgi:type II secretory pathway component GspD/PulD (secretin)